LRAQLQPDSSVCTCYQYGCHGGHPSCVCGRTSSVGNGLCCESFKQAALRRNETALRGGGTQAVGFSSHAMRARCRQAASPPRPSNRILILNRTRREIENGAAQWALKGVGFSSHACAAASVEQDSKARTTLGKKSKTGPRGPHFQFLAERAVRTHRPDVWSRGSRTDL
jgi:hypothetical protein